MRTLLLAGVAALIFAAPAVAQNMDQAGHGPPQAMPDHSEHTEHGERTDHAGHSDPAPETDAHGHADHSGHAPPARPESSPDPHAHHTMDMPMADAITAPNTPPPAAAFSGPLHAAETLFPAQEMAASRKSMAREMGPMTVTTVRFDRLEMQSGTGTDGWLWDMDIRHGADIDKLWFKSEGHAAFGHKPEAEIQALWSHAIGPWFDVQTGVRKQIRRGPDRTQAVLGVQGLAPYFFELDGALFLSTKGELTGRIEAEYDQRITRRLILQPRLEINLSAQDIPELGMGTGITALQAGARLRYEVVREFAPYIGIEWQRDVGDTARFTRAAGDAPDRFLFVAGIKTWF